MVSSRGEAVNRPSSFRRVRSGEVLLLNGVILYSVTWHEYFASGNDTANFIARHVGQDLNRMIVKVNHGHQGK